MSPALRRREDCRLCGSRRVDLALGLTPTPLADAYVAPSRRSEAQPSFPLDVFLCRECGYTGLLDVIPAEEIYPEYIYETASSLGLVAHFARYADDVVAALEIPPGALAVDIGSNDGALLRALRAKGLRVLGVDPAREIAAQATASGIETRPAFFDDGLAADIRRESGPATLLTANNIVANVDDLDVFVKGVRTLLAPEGAFVFETAYLPDLVRNMVFDFIYHEHLSYFAVQPLLPFFRRHGLELTDVQRIPTKGGSMRCTVRLGGTSPRPSVAAFLEEERDAGLPGAPAWATFASRIEAARTAFARLLEGVEPGSRIDAYGASATSTTLLYHFGLGPRLSALYDDYPAKQGLLSPGLHLPVIAPAQLYERRPAVVVLLAWRYEQPIRDKHRRYLEQGGRFLVPLPEPRVV